MVDISKYRRFKLSENAVGPEEDYYEVSLYGKEVDVFYLKEWVESQDAKLLTLDGSLGGYDGSKFSNLTTDIEAQDNWHIGKKYDMQSWFRFPMVLELLDDDSVQLGKKKVHISIGEEIGMHNSYLVVSKRKLREDFKTLRRAKTEELELKAFEMVRRYVEGFNVIADGVVYEFEFRHESNGEENIERINDVCVNVMSHSYEFIMHKVIINLPSVNGIYDGLLRGIFTHLSNIDTNRLLFEKRFDIYKPKLNDFLGDYLLNVQGTSSKRCQIYK